MTLIARFSVDGFEPRQVTGPDGRLRGLVRQARIRHDDQGAYFEITLAS